MKQIALCLVLVSGASSAIAGPTMDCRANTRSLEIFSTNDTPSRMRCEYSCTVQGSSTAETFNSNGNTQLEPMSGGMIASQATMFDIQRTVGFRWTCAAAPAPATPIVEAATATQIGYAGPIRQNINLVKETFNDIHLPDLAIPAGETGSALIAYDIPVQRGGNEICPVISRLLVDGQPVGLQQLDHLVENHTISIKNTHVLPALTTGSHTVVAQIYPNCDQMTVTYTTWIGGEWGGNYNYLVLR